MVYILFSEKFTIQTLRRLNLNETKFTTRWTRCCATESKIRLYYCLYQAQLKHCRFGIYTRVRWVSFDYSKREYFFGIVLYTILSYTQHTTLAGIYAHTLRLVHTFLASRSKYKPRICMRVSLFVYVQHDIYKYKHTRTHTTRVR